MRHPPPTIPSPSTKWYWHANEYCGVDLDQNYYWVANATKIWRAEPLSGAREFFQRKSTIEPPAFIRALHGDWLRFVGED